jgi:tRNA(Ile)-lysidine synthase
VDEWLRKIEENIERRKLFRRGESILVAVSGGLDSIVLLHLLYELSEANGWKVNIAHFNHQLRGRSSDADEKLVERTAAKLNCNFISERGEVKKFAKSNRISIEMAARTLRHEFLARTAKRLKIKTVALAHHADDQIELFFLRLLRGTGTDGLSGMSCKTTSPADKAIQLVRPLLDQPKELLREFARENRIRFREDATNLSTDFERNRIRLEVLPILKAIQPALENTVTRTMGIIAAESDFVVNAAQEWLRQPTHFDPLHIAVQRVCLRLQLRRMKLPTHFDLVEQLRLEPNKIITVNPKTSVYRDSKGIIHTRAKKEFSFNDLELGIDLAQSNEAVFAGKKLSWSFQNRKGDSFLREQNCEWFDAGKISSRIRLRHWKAGDRFQPIGAKKPKKLQDLFTDLKISRGERHDRIVAVTEQGEIFWVEGLRISECFKLDTTSRRRLKWHLQCFGEAVAGKP